MRFARVLVMSSLVVCSGVAFAQDDRLPVIRPQFETVKASPTPFPFADKQPSDYDTWIRTPWVQMNRAKCDKDCMQVTVRTISGLATIDSSGAKKGPAKVRLALTIPASCGEYAWYGEMKDQTATGAALKDPSTPIDGSRVHVFRFDETGREISMVFQNEHTSNARQARLNVLCKTKS